MMMMMNDDKPDARKSLSHAWLASRRSASKSCIYQCNCGESESTSNCRGEGFGAEAAGAVEEGRATEKWVDLTITLTLTLTVREGLGEVSADTLGGIVTE